MTPTPDSYTSKQIVRLCGITRRMLQWLCDEGIVRVPVVSGGPAVGGLRRRFTDRHLAQIRLIAKLRRKGASLQRIRQWPLDELEGKRGYLATDGKRLIYCPDETSAIQVFTQSRRGLVLIELGGASDHGA